MRQFNYLCVCKFSTSVGVDVVNLREAEDRVWQLEAELNVVKNEKKVLERQVGGVCSDKGEQAKQCFSLR